MPQVVRTQIILNPSAAPAEQVMNTWHSVTVGATTPLASATAFQGALQTFYNAVDAQYSNEFSGATPLMRSFDLSEPKPRQPIVETTAAAMSTSTDRGAREIACCLSYKGVYLSGISPKRKRGRIYLGPLTRGAVDATNGLFTTAFVGVIVTAATALVTASDASATFRWVIYSPTTDTAGTGLDADSWDAVTSGWVDDNPDIQRRRSPRTANKTLWT